MLKECLLPSQEWIQMGEGDIGHLYLEIIKCDNLPNMVGFSSMVYFLISFTKVMHSNTYFIFFLV